MHRGRILYNMQIDSLKSYLIILIIQQILIYKLILSKTQNDIFQPNKYNLSEICQFFYIKYLNFLQIGFNLQFLMESDKQDKQQLENKQQQKQQAHKQIDLDSILTLEEGKQKGLSKQQMRKLQKKLAVAKKKKQRQQTEAKKQEHQGKQHGKDKKNPTNKKEVQLSPQYLKQFSEQKIQLKLNTSLPSKQKNNILITSALPYVNNVPHLGNIIGCVLSADVYARFKRLQGDNVLYISGTDQYGTATEVKALQQKLTPREVCDKYHKIHGEVYKWFDIGFDSFGRTSTDWHSKIVQEIFLDLQKQDKIIKQEMTQCYCEICDLTLADRFIGGTCPYCGYQDARGDQCDKCQKLFNNPTQMKNYFCTVCKNSPILKETIHFFINLPLIQQQVQKWVEESSTKGRWSENSIGVTKGWFKIGLKPKCITRDLKWGVSVPIEQFKKKIFYVWFDAPIGYISISANHLGQQYKQWWQSKIVDLYQFMGKDNIPFHTIMFPSSLIGTKKDWTLLHHVSTTEYLNYEGKPFSKRNGTGVFGDAAPFTGIPSQVWRYYLLVNRPQKSDSQFTWNDFIQKNNNQLLANLGNLCNRALKYVYASYDKKIPKIKPQQLNLQDQQFIKIINEKYTKYKQVLNAVQIKQGLKLSMQVSSLGNKFLQDSQFWTKQNKESGRSMIISGIICNFIRFISFLIEPYMPSCSAKINFLLGLKRSQFDDILGKVINQSNFTDTFCKLTEKSSGLRQPVPLFKQYTEQQAEKWRQQFKGKQA